MRPSKRLEAPASSSAAQLQTAAPKQQRQQRVSRQNNKHNCVTSPTVPMAATSAATLAASCKMRTSGSRSRRRRRVGSISRGSRCYAAVSSNANALPLRSGSLSLAATALSLSQRATEKERGIERGRAREFVWARSHKICLFWLSVRACKLCRAERRKAEQRSNCAARRVSLLGLLVRAYSESLSA